ncbi:hypothetical protein [Tepidicaulis sp.]|uniref:hypothetical protein n=1 Tax=Tepidicaulis sp. TaxID=1920809 RepID=UPI003B5C9E76
MPIHKEQTLFKNWSKFRKQDNSFAILTTSDYALLEDFLENDPVTQGESALLLRRLARHKMTRTRTVFPQDIDGHVATSDSFVTFSIEGQSNCQRRLIRNTSHSAADQTLEIFSLLGITLLGMGSGQSAALLKADGNFTYVTLHAVKQPRRLPLSRPGSPQGQASKDNFRHPSSPSSIKLGGKVLDFLRPRQINAPAGSGGSPGPSAA